MTDLWSVADALDRLVPPADPAVAADARVRLCALAAHLPAALTRVIYLESWIAQLRSRLDLIVKIEPRDRDALVELSDRLGWADVARFAREWAIAGSRLDDSVHAAWIELDLDPRLAPEDALRAPRMFVDFTRAAQSQPSVEARIDLASEMLVALSGTRAPPALRTCLEQLPDGASVASLCVLPGEPPIVRACVVGLADRLTAYLAAISWPGDVDALARRVLAPFARTQEGVPPVGVLHLDLAPDVAPRLGLEYTFPRPGRVAGVRTPGTFLRQLVARGWCTARNREALRAWPRRSIELLPHDVWHSRVTREIAHVKLAYTPGEPVVAKAYLRAMFALLAGGSLLAGRPRVFDGARALSDGGVPPSAAADLDAALPQPRDRPAARARARGGTAVALLARRGIPGMTMSTTQQEALEQILNRATVDLEFRKALLHDPRKAIQGLGIRIPANFRVKFIERHKDVDALIVLPDLVREDGELEDCDLDAVAGGADGDAPLPW